LVAVTENCNVMIAQGLRYEIRYDASIVWMHTRTIGIEDSRDLDRQPPPGSAGNAVRCAMIIACGEARLVGNESAAGPMQRVNQKCVL
jgi:hypothetical protein